MGSLLTEDRAGGGPPDPAGGGTPRDPWAPGDPDPMETVAEVPLGGPLPAPLPVPASDLTLPGLWLG